jgi:hypothetical protein
MFLRPLLMISSRSQQAVSALTNLNGTVFADGGAQFTKFGVEYWSNPDNRGEGYMEWVADQPVIRIDNNVFSGDSSLGISSRLISEEPMAIVLNLAISGAPFIMFPKIYH